MDNSGSITYSSSFHRITEAGKDPDIIESNLWLDTIMSTQCHIQSLLKQLQGCWFHHLSGHVISMLDNPPCVEIPLKAQPLLEQPLPLMSLVAREKRPIPNWPHLPVRSEGGQELGFPLHRSIATTIYMQTNSTQVPGRIYLDLDQLLNLLIFQFVEESMQVKKLHIQTGNLHAHLCSQIINSACLHTLLMKLKPYGYKTNYMLLYLHIN